MHGGRRGLLAELERACPGVSRDMVRRVLWGLQKTGKVECLVSLDVQHARVALGLEEAVAAGLPQSR